MSHTELQDQIFKKVVESKFENKLEPLGQQLAMFLKDFAFLYEKDKSRLLDIVLQSFIHNYDEEENKFQFDFEYVLDQTPIASKELLFQQVITKFTDNVDLYELGGNSNESKGDIDTHINQVEDTGEESLTEDTLEEPSDVLDF